METKKLTDGRTDAEGYNIIRPFFKRAYENQGGMSKRHIVTLVELSMLS